MKNFVEQISLKFRGFGLINMNLVQTVLCTPKYLWKFIYRPMFKRLKYRSVSSKNKNTILGTVNTADLQF